MNRPAAPCTANRYAEGETAVEVAIGPAGIGEPSGVADTNTVDTRVNRMFRYVARLGTSSLSPALYCGRIVAAPNSGRTTARTVCHCATRVSAGMSAQRSDGSSRRQIFAV